MTKRMKMALLAAAILVLWIGARWSVSLTRPSHELGDTDGRLARCPDRPNCVSTQADDRLHRMNPLEFDGTSEQAQQAVVLVIESMPRSRIVKQTRGYIHVEFRSLVFGFVDDVEFVIDDQSRQVHFRSASRIGHSDLGANRKRMEAITLRFRENELSR